MRLGFIGGYGHHYLRGAISDPTCDITEIAVSGDGHDDARAESFARSLPNNPRWFPDAAAMIDQFRPHAVSVGTIYGFNGEHRFLSNFEPSAITMADRITYPTVEHAYQAAKATSLAARERIAALATPGGAKRAGRALVLRDDWERVKDAVMLACLRAKFGQHPELAAKLLATGDRELIEANTWGDRVWGVDYRTGAGENRLGIALMAVRTELRS